jgi:hypothetical protein
MARGKKKLILKIAKMVGNCMVEKYLWNDQGIIILHTKK